MKRELTEIEFKKTFGNSMTDITQMETEDPIEIWGYVESLAKTNVVNQIVFDKKLVELVYRNDLETFDHILLPTKNKNLFTVIVVDLKNKVIFGHRLLDLNKEYGLK